MVRERFSPAECYLTDFTPVMGAHTGPGVFGVGYLVE
jgi:fatty acid-binding protein DegV